MGNSPFANFVDAIPADKLTGFPTEPKKIYNNTDLRLDMQKMVNGRHNLQVQVNSKCKSKYLEPLKPCSLAVVFAVSNADPEKVRQALFDSYNKMLSSAKAKAETKAKIEGKGKGKGKATKGPNENHQKGLEPIYSNGSPVYVTETIQKKKK